MLRDEVVQLTTLGPLPDSESATDEQLKQYEKHLLSISRPVNDEEARVLTTLFTQDDCYEMAWTLIHLVESAPKWPLKDCLKREDNQWINLLRHRASKL